MSTIYGRGKLAEIAERNCPKNGLNDYKDKTLAPHMIRLE